MRSADFNFASGKMVYLANDFKHLDDLYVADLNGKNERKLTNLNAGVMETASVRRGRAVHLQERGRLGR